MILMIDNYDSFTYNLVQYLGELGAEVETVRNDAVTVEDIAKMKPEGIVISPGPCTPDEAGICLEVVKTLGPMMPILGVCLGHQCIGQAFGAKVVRAERIMHGKTSMIYHRSQGIFHGLPQPFEATRYHSLVLQPDSIPEDLNVMAWCEYQGGHEIMGVKHRLYDIEGVQFHPESILTRNGHDLLKNFLQSISMLY
ncbi:MAG: aminodeoxychorismate/anthranilate synthase component II [Gammaproteobacteria bacterium]|nr:aminodeoxychorismate/anthranilate synthase component II [Gammaproteobacteria bacterium]MBT8054096.1 aminodeoxychorismate/anthranilate synthase component II [Gammaproteobacteria bacterium]